MLLPGRRDKYQRHIREYWVDVATTGFLATELEEQFLQQFEVTDCNMEMPAPTLGSCPMPPEEEDFQEDCSSADSDGESASNGSKTKKSKKHKAGKESRPSTPSKASKKLRKIPKPSADKLAIEEALED